MSSSANFLQRFEGKQMIFIISNCFKKLKISSRFMEIFEFQIYSFQLPEDRHLKLLIHWSMQWVLLACYWTQPILPCSLCSDQLLELLMSSLGFDLIFRPCLQPLHLPKC